MFAAFFNVSRLPERIYPVTFDIVGHNHQLMHTLTALGTLAHFWGIYVDINERKDHMETLLEGLTAYSSLGWTFTTLVVTCAMTLWFSSKLTPLGHIIRD